MIIWAIRFTFSKYIILISSSFLYLRRFHNHSRNAFSCSQFLHCLVFFFWSHSPPINVTTLDHYTPIPTNSRFYLVSCSFILSPITWSKRNKKIRLLEMVSFRSITQVSEISLNTNIGYYDVCPVFIQVCVCVFTFNYV